MERARTVLEAGIPGGSAVTRADMEAQSQEEVRTQERVTNVALAVTLVIAGCSLAVAVSGTIVERRQAFAQLRLAGTRLADLRRVVMAEAAAPLLVVAGASVALGLAVSALVLAAAGSNEQFVLPGSGYWLRWAAGSRWRCWSSWRRCRCSPASPTSTRPVSSDGPSDATS